MRPNNTRIIQKDIDGVTHSITCNLYDETYKLSDPMTGAEHEGTGGYAEAVAYLNSNGGV